MSAAQAVDNVSVPKSPNDQEEEEEGGGGGGERERDGRMVCWRCSVLAYWCCR